MQAIHDNVLIRPDKQEEKIGSIIVPDSAKKKQETGTVVSVGDGKDMVKAKHIKPDFNVGDHVLYVNYTGFPVEHDGVPHVMMKQQDILAIINH